jgi:hypothetical protein
MWIWANDEGDPEQWEPMPPDPGPVYKAPRGDRVSTTFVSSQIAATEPCRRLEQPTGKPPVALDGNLVVHSDGDDEYGDTEGALREVQEAWSPVWAEVERVVGG